MLSYLQIKIDTTSLHVHTYTSSPLIHCLQFPRLYGCRVGLVPIHPYLPHIWSCCLFSNKAVAISGTSPAPVFFYRWGWICLIETSSHLRDHLYHFIHLCMVMMLACSCLHYLCFRKMEYICVCIGHLCFQEESLHDRALISTCITSPIHLCF